MRFSMLLTVVLKEKWLHQVKETLRVRRNVTPRKTHQDKSPGGPKESNRQLTQKVQQDMTPWKSHQEKESREQRKRLQLIRWRKQHQKVEYIAKGEESVYRTHVCPECRRCFTMRSHLTVHLRLHFPDPSLQCPKCKRHFTSKSKLRVHLLREAGEKGHHCDLCDYSAVDRSSIRRHMITVHADEAEDETGSCSFPCPTCGQVFYQSKLLKAHMKTHSSQPHRNSQACFHDGCSFQSSAPKLLLKHISDEHSISPVECRHHACTTIFPDSSSMEAHYQTHLAYHCQHCDFSCANKSAFLQHKRHGHAGTDELTCDFCTFVTFNPVEFEQHVGHMHASEKIHRCSQCNYMTPHKRGLKRHMQLHTAEKPHKCSRCDFRCRDVYYLSKHMLTHSDAKKFMCSECGYVTKWKHSLSVHMRKHAGDLRYHCDQCPYRAYRLDQLKSHKLRHQGKSLICEVCAYACKRKHELRNHMLAKHSADGKEVSLFKCRYCAYSSSHQQALRNHENCKHTKQKEYQCALCVYSSFSSVGFFLHKRKAHGYVPGDKAWLEHYKAREKEMRSQASSQDFYCEPSVQQLPEEPSVSADQDRNGEYVSHSQAANVLDVVCQEIVDDRIPSVSSPEYCTLVLTALPTADYASQSLQNEPSGVMGNGFETSQADKSPSTLVEEDARTSDASESDSQNRKCLSTLASPEKSLNYLRKYDRDQADAMVKEGRVQMLVVPSSDVFRCDKCPFVGRREDLKNHRSLCRGRKPERECQTSSAQFKLHCDQECHFEKRCPATMNSNSSQVVTKDAGHDDVNQVDRGVDSEQVEIPQKENSLNAFEPQMNQQNKGEDSKKCLLRRRTKLTLDKSEGQCKTFSEEKLPSRPKRTNAGKRRTYSSVDGNFKCRLCDFSSLKLVTLRQHISNCHQESRLAEETHPAGSVDDANAETLGCKVLKKSSTHRKLSHEKQLDGTKAKTLKCHNCAFTCKQKRSMAQHVALKHSSSKPFSCPHCPFTTRRRYVLENHKTLHTGLGRLRCDLCDKTFRTTTLLSKHKLRIHEKRPTLQCSLCEYSAYTSFDLKRHELRCHTGELRHVCARCKAGFSSQFALRNHCNRAHQPQTIFSCKQCDYICNTEEALKNHQQHKHLQLKCTTCHHSFVTKEQLEIHRKTHVAHHCQLCPFACKTKKLLAKHLSDKHEDGSASENALKCSSCEFSSGHQLVMEQHLRSHGGKRLYKCTDCKYSTWNKQKITWHIRIHTGEKPYSCTQCRYTCTDPSRLKLHMRVHQEERMYLCPECGYKCKWATQLKCHMTKHTGEKPYACDKCDYRSNRADALRAHKVTQHCDVRLYVCEKCGKAFKTSFLLKTHQRQHTDERAYTCGQCHKSFRWPAGLRHHYLSHTNQQPFSCRHCNYKAKQRFQVVKHLKKHHPGRTVEDGVVKDSEGSGLTLKEALQGVPFQQEQQADGIGGPIQE
ncbi:zinc finger protein 142 isoform X1 [Synchiropus splendidus]|uniref:zinc finger protein 142 isoform X1 n=1 Tax=Synchiropus splendidus TaxID=270530 RepID=UPI00237E14F5|nr:zinc finger protein 142 isoform X1 [Synchiropus splendidus]XP_053733226.1 zinc finger protein 142 isoform X1 [Synchiropus splendidus]